MTLTASPLMSPNPPGGPSASAIFQRLQAQGISHVVTVPDFVQFSLHAQLAQNPTAIRSIFAASEDQAVTTAAGLWMTGAKPVVLVQNQGLYKCTNTLRAVCMDAGVPLLFMVGQFGREVGNVGQHMTQSSRSMVRLMLPYLDALGVSHWTLEEDRDLDAIQEASTHALDKETAAVVLVSRHTTWA